LRQRVNQAAEILGIRELLQRKPKQLSGGQRQRVALGRAIVREPQVFLMDEPLSNLDAKLRVQTRAELIKLHQRLQTTVIYVTHDQIEAMTMGSRIAVLRDGVLQQLDTPQTVYDHPSNMFVAGFIGSPAMNFFPAELTTTEGQMSVDTGAFQMNVPTQFGPKLKTFGKNSVILGIRPEDMYDRNWAPRPAGAQPRPHEGGRGRTPGQRNLRLPAGRQPHADRAPRLPNRRKRRGQHRPGAGCFAHSRLRSVVAGGLVLGSARLKGACNA